jgi:hypothetical protein
MDSNAALIAAGCIKQCSGLAGLIDYLQKNPTTHSNNILLTKSDGTPLPGGTTLKTRMNRASLSTVNGARSLGGRRIGGCKAAAAVHFWLRRSSRTPSFRPIAGL